MADLLARGAGADLFPLSAGGARVAELPFETIHAVFGATGAEVAEGLAMPEPGRSASAGGGRVLWSGRDQAMLVGAAPHGSARAADQSDAWCRVLLSGPRARAVLARLVPVDLREAAFSEGAVARTLLGHMSALIHRRQDGFEVWVMRSMAGTLVHDLERAMRQVATRDAAGL